MKRCTNPNCASDFLFGNNKTTCPFCHSRLVNSGDANRMEAQTIVPPDMVTVRDEPQQAETAEFMRERFGKVICTGRILEIDHHEVFNSRFHKLINSLIRGEPYQFAHQTAEYTIRVENITDGIATEVTDFCLYGNYLGRLQVGDEVVVHAKKHRDRRIVRSIYNRTTDSPVRPGFQLSAGVIRTVFLTIAILIFALLCECVQLITSGTMASGMVGVLSDVMPTILVIIGIWLIFRSILPRRRR